jgi:RNA 2',3'-cyclic 3'-phosphodiesterase
MPESTQDSLPDPGAVATQRLFFALWPTEVQQRQWHQQAGSMLAGCHGRLVAAHNLHLTLVFLGPVSNAVRQCLERAVADIHGAPFTLVLDTAGYWYKPQVVWLGCSELPVPLARLVSALSTAARDCGLTPDTRTYRPHLTLARKVRRDPGNFPLTPFIWPVEGFALVESLSPPEGVLYRPVRRWDL